MPQDNEFEREKICYAQNFEQARSVNAQMNQVPVTAMTLTGGLWFGAGVTEHIPTEIRFALLMFAGLCNLALILSVLRIRDVLESYLEKIRSFREASFASGRPTNPMIPWLGSYSMISIYAVLMLIAAFFSFFGAFWRYWPFEISVVWGIAALTVVLVVVYMRLFTRFVPPRQL